ncbi:tetratricopeptide repeat protein [Pandoraea terrae]|uniref:tetratricopeptide repeat protein n=1 Tax=Pandoraea terrae TaxID=1537710 RepID=UPI001242D47C|nr:hypothetical protein [Pandoraea terrae]
MSSKQTQSTEYCDLHFDVDNHTGLNFSDLWIKVVTRDSTGNIVEQAHIHDRVTPHGQAAMSLLASHCPSVSSVELMGVERITEVDGAAVPSDAANDHIMSLPLRWANRVQDLSFKATGGPMPDSATRGPSSQDATAAPAPRGTNLLERALDPFAPRKTLFDQFQDQGDLNAVNTFYGLPVHELSVQWKRSGGYSVAIMEVPAGVAPVQVRTALSAACEVAPSAWTYAVDPWPRGSAKNGEMTCSYVGSERSSGLEVSIGPSEEPSANTLPAAVATVSTESSPPGPVVSNGPAAPVVATAAQSDPLAPVINCHTAADCAKAMLTAAKSQNLAAAMAAATAMAALPKPARGDRGTARKLNNDGLSALSSGDTNRAVKLFSQATFADPGDQEALGNLAFAYSAAGDQIKAEDTAVLALSINARRTSIWAPLAVTLAKERREGQALEAMWLAYQFSGDKEKTLSFIHAKLASETDPAVSKMYADSAAWFEQNKTPDGL